MPRACGTALSGPRSDVPPPLIKRLDGATRAKVRARRGQGKEALQQSAEAVEWAAELDYFEQRELPFVVAINCFNGIQVHAIEDVREGDQVLSCEGTGVAPVVPKTLTSSGAKRGFFTRQDFIYDAYGANTTYVRYQLLRATDTLHLELRPLVTYRDFHQLSRRIQTPPGGAPQRRPRRTPFAFGWGYGADLGGLQGVGVVGVEHRPVVDRAGKVRRVAAARGVAARGHRAHLHLVRGTRGRRSRRRGRWRHAAN